MDNKVLQAKDLLKTSSIIKIPPEATLKEALAKLTRSHDAVFVFDKKNKFMGVVSPYYSIFKSKHPPNTKVRNTLFKPPQITMKTYIWDIARLMTESKVYYLPVFSNSDFLGIVTVNRVFRAIQSRKDLTEQLSLKLKKDLITISTKAKLSDAYNLMRDKQVSRIPVVDSNNHLKGIVSRFDIRAALAEPKEKISWLSRAGDKDKYLEHPLEGYYNKIVVTAPLRSSAQDLLRKMVNNKVGSIVIIDKDRRAIGIISSHDMLKTIENLRPKRATNIDLKVDQEFTQRARLEEIIGGFTNKINKYNPVARLGLVVEGVKNPAGKIKRYSVHGVLLLKNGKRIAAKVTERDWKKAVHKAIHKVRRQLPR